MTSLDDRLVPRAKALLLKYGRDAVFSVPASLTPNPSSGTVTEGVVTTYTRKVTPTEGWNPRFVPREIWEEGDQFRYVAAKDIGFLPVPGMKVELGAEVWRIEGVSPVETGELVALYGLHLKR